MAFYKLFRILHRRTDWERLLDWERQFMMPEWYEEHARQLASAYQKLMFPIRVCKNLLGDKADYYLQGL